MAILFTQQLLYNILIIIALFFSIREIIYKKRFNRNVFNLVLLIYFLIGFNNRITFDNINYREMINQTKNNKNIGVFSEKIYPYILEKLNYKYEYFMAIILIFNIYLLKKILKNEKRIYTSLLLYLIGFGYESLNTIRANLGLTIVLFSLNLLKQNKNIKGKIFSLSSIIFHKSMFVPVIFLNFLKKNWTLKKFVFALGFAILLSRSILKKFIFFILELNFFQRYQFYLNESKEQLKWYVEIFLKIPFYINFLATFVIIFFILKNKRKFYLKKDVNIYINFSIIGLILSVGIYNLNLFKYSYMRIFNIFNSCFFIWVPYFLSEKKIYFYIYLLLIFVNLIWLNIYISTFYKYWI